ncbi:MAG: DUF4465 domain-containing protein [Bacteroidia bacterium]|jgi:hypothetical protein|nr:DUF4465 domain-containing protein [Bacteroidia bacterium]
MKKQIFTSLIVVLTIVNLKAQTVADFESLGLSTNQVLNGAGDPVNSNFSSGNILFNNTYQTVFGGYWSAGWAYSTLKNDSTPGLTNLYASYAAKGNANSMKYGVGQQGSTIRTSGADAGDTIYGFYVTNSTYAGLSMKTGDMFAKKFGGNNGDDPDFFVMTIKGWKNGNLLNDTVAFYLADFRSPQSTNDYIIKDWTYVDLKSLGKVDSIRITLQSSDVGQFGMNTPAFYCIDDIITKNDTADFENLNLSAGRFWNKANTTVRQVYGAGHALFPSRLTVASWGDFWSGGWAISNKTDSTTAQVNGLDKIYNAVTGTGADSTKTYALGQQGAVVRLNGLAKGVSGFYLTNSNYAFISMKYGDAFAKKFTDSDFFKVTVKGYKNGNVLSTQISANLATGVNLLKTWQWVDVSSIGEVDSISFHLSSSDTGAFGMNTPAFFCIDQLTTIDKSSGKLDNKFQVQATVYPNPVTEYMEIKLNNGKEVLEVKVYGIDGKLVQTHKATTRIDVKDLPEGMYHAVIFDGLNYGSVKIMVQK